MIFSLGFVNIILVYHTDAKPSKYTKIIWKPDFKPYVMMPYTVFNRCYKFFRSVTSVYNYAGFIQN